MKIVLLAGLALVVTGCGAGTGVEPEAAPRATRSPGSLADLPQGPASEVPWWQAGALHVAGQDVETPYRDLIFAGGTTVVGGSSVEDGARWFLLDGERLVPLVSSDRPLEPVVSSDGRAVVWSQETGDTSRHLVAYDVSSGTERGSADVTVHPVCCDRSGDLFVLGVDGDGRVIYDVLGQGAHTWTPGGGDVPVTGVPGGALDPEPWPGGVLWQGRSADVMRLPGVYATVDESGAVHRVGTVETDQLGTWNADGTAYAYPAQADGHTQLKAPMTDVWVDHVDTGSRTRLLLPPDRTFEVVAWESPTSVVLQTRNAYGEPVPAGERPGLVALVRCDAESGACERTGDDVRGNVVLPAPR